MVLTIAYVDRKVASEEREEGAVLMATNEYEE